MMQAVLLVDFGSTYTKVTAVDVDTAMLLGTASVHTTVDTDINDGLMKALSCLTEKTGPLTFTKQFACSSAAGGLRMITAGLVPELTAEAARLASLGAGAKVIKVFSFHLTRSDVQEIARLKPDIFLLTGGIDGGNTDCILHNAKVLSACEGDFPIVVAGNRNAADECAHILRERKVYVCENVLPKLNTLNIEPVQHVIRELFLNRIIQAKGLSKTQKLLDGILMPTPSAMMRAMELLAGGTKNTPGLGELVAVDLGGATTDVYSVAKGAPGNDNVILRGLPEPYSKRTVEGDIGMRYSAAGTLEAAGIDKITERSGLTKAEIESYLLSLQQNPGILPEQQKQKDFDFALASAAIEVAVRRHAGSMEQVYTPTGPAYVQYGKDLTRINTLIMTGGAIVHNEKAAEISSYALYNPNAPESLTPKRAAIYIDRKYILSAMGLLGEEYPETAISIMKKELEKHEAVEQTPNQ